MKTDGVAVIEARKHTTWAFVVATFFGAGYGKPGPGTWGSVAAVLLWAAYAWLAHPSPHGMMAALIVGIVISIAIGVPAATIAAREVGREDPQFVVIDEVAGQLIALVLMPADWKHAVVALLLFRGFDIFKPWPIRKLEALPEGTGIMLDDIAAGAFALVVGFLLCKFVPGLG